MNLQNLRQTLRTLRKSPAFLVLVVLTLSFGIGANTTVFSIAQAVLLRSMNFPDSERLMFLSRGYPGFPQGGGNFTYPAYRDILQQNRSFDDVAAFQSFGALALTDSAEPVRVNINYITPSYLTLLGARTSFGRLFRREEDRVEDADPVIVLSDGFWQREFARGNVVGRVIHLNQQAFTVVGITAASFLDAPGEIDTGEPVDAWIPLGLSNRLTGLNNPGDRNRAILWGVDISNRESRRRKPVPTLLQSGNGWPSNIPLQTPVLPWLRSHSKIASSDSSISRYGC